VRPAAGDPAARRWLRLAFVWGLAEASIFFIVPDVVIGWIGLSRGVRFGLRAARNAALGAVVGGAAMFLWSERSPDAALRAVQSVPAVSAAMIEDARQDIEARGWFRAALSGPTTSTPYKVYAVLAPEAGTGLVAWLLGAVPIRLPRFMFVGAAFGLLGWIVRRRFAPRPLAVIYAAAWVAFYGWFFLAHPN
jgi:hypothetical protein